MLIKNTILAVAVLASSFSVQAAATQQDPTPCTMLARTLPNSVGVWTDPSGKDIFFSVTNRVPGIFAMRFSGIGPNNPLSYYLTGTCEKDIVTLTGDSQHNVPKAKITFSGKVDAFGKVMMAGDGYRVEITSAK